MDDLAGADDLYLNDSIVRIIRLSHGANMVGSELQPVDILNTFPFTNGSGGMMTAGSYDKLYLSSNQQSFEEGFVGIVSTTSNQLTNMVKPNYQDQGVVYVDWYDPKRVFVTTYDAFVSYDPDAGLYLYLIYDDVIVDSLLLGKNTSFGSFRNMVFDPVRQRLYLTHDDSITVVQVNYGAGPASASELKVSAEVKPGEASTLTAPDGSAEISFPGNAVNQAITVTYQETIQPPQSRPPSQPAPPPAAPRIRRASSRSAPCSAAPTPSSRNSMENFSSSRFITQTRRLLVSPKLAWASIVWQAAIGNWCLPASLPFSMRALPPTLPRPVPTPCEGRAGASVSSCPW